MQTTTEFSVRPPNPSAPQFSTGTPSSPQQLQATLREVAMQARQIDIRGFEERDREAMLAELVPPVAALLKATAEALDSVLGTYPAEATEPNAFYRAADGHLRGLPSARQVADLAFIARWEIGRKQAALDAVATHTDPWKVLSDCGSATRRARKSAIAVEMALAEYENLPSALLEFHVSDLDISVESRRAYASFCSGLMAGGDPDESNMQARLRSAAVNIAKLIGRDVYEELRITDRAQLRQLQHGIVRWLAGSDGFPVRRGLRLWQDLAAFASLLLQINNRTELREHDLGIVKEVLAALPNVSADDPLPAPVLARLRRISGRDEELDTLLARRDLPSETWRAPLERLAAVLGPTNTPAPASPPESPEDFL